MSKNTRFIPSPLEPFQVENGKAQFMDMLYELSGRTNGLYSGLWQQFQQDVAEQSRRAWIEHQHNPEP